MARRRQRKNATVKVNITGRATAPPRRNRRRRRARNQRRFPLGGGITAPGVAFLKCAFASPDFNTDPGKGIPDAFEGKVLSRKDVLTLGKSFTPETDTYILVTPTPGVACFVGEVGLDKKLEAGNGVTSVNFPGFTDMFTSSTKTRDMNVTAFRYASMNVGVYPTSNQQQYGGSISIWKCPLKLAPVQMLNKEGTVASMHYKIDGTHSVNEIGSENYTHGFIDGAYSTSVNSDHDFDFQSIICGLDNVPSKGAELGDVGQDFGFSTSGGGSGIVGWGDMDTIVIRVTTPKGAVNSAIIKVWACLEYRPNPSAMVYQFGHDSPPLDELALREYRMVARNLPVAVTAAENGRMWELVKRIIRGGLHIGSHVPGPIGVAASGLQGLGVLFENWNI